MMMIKCCDIYINVLEAYGWNLCDRQESACQHSAPRSKKNMVVCHLKRAWEKCHEFLSGWSWESIRGLFVRLLLVHGVQAELFLSHPQHLWRPMYGEGNPGTTICMILIHQLLSVYLEERSSKYFPFRAWRLTGEWSSGSVVFNALWGRNTGGIPCLKITIPIKY